MPINVSNITASQKDKILSLEEGHFVDLKAIDIGPAQLTKHIAAFANADGGELYIGIDENKVENTRVWRGFLNQESANGHIQCFENLFPLGQDFDYTFIRCADVPGLLLKIEIKKTADIKKSSDDTVYLRRGPQSLPQSTADQIDRLKLNKGIRSFEAETVRAPLQMVTNSYAIINFMLEIIPSAEPIEWLKKQLLIYENKPTVACVALFSDEPQALLPKRTGIKIYRYKTSDIEGSRDTLDFNPISIDGCLYDQIHHAVSKTKEIVENINISGPTGLEKTKYPSETLHEIITNAVLHRDYSIPDDIHIRIFDNRIEVQSPGTLPGHVTVKNILQERFARNPSIVRLINKFPNPPNKDVGEGLNTAFDAMRKLRLKDPVIKQQDSSVILQIRHESLASPEEIVVEYLKHNESITNRSARSLCHIGSENKMKDVFKRLIKKRMIERVPGLEGSAAAYRKAT